MKRRIAGAGITAGLAILCSAQLCAAPLQVYILAGQSNMEGHARVSAFDHLGLDPKTEPLLKEMRTNDESPRICERVWISYFNGKEQGGQDVCGALTAGYGARRTITKSDDKIGPEFTFGITMQKRHDGPVLIIKTAWGGKSLHTDFRSPSAGPYAFNAGQLDGLKKKGKNIEEATAERTGQSGVYYKLMLGHVQRVLKDIGRVYPDYDATQGYALAGFVWFQGWNDMVARDVYPTRGKPGGYALYSELLAHFIRDVRKDLKTPHLPFVIGVMGAGGPVADYSEGALRYKDIHQGFRDAMAAPASLPEFKGNVTTVWTENYWDPELDAVSRKGGQLKQKSHALRKAGVTGQAHAEQLEAFKKTLYSPRDLEVMKGITNAGYHYLGSPKIMALIGQAFADALLTMDQ